MKKKKRKKTQKVGKRRLRTRRISRNIQRAIKNSVTNTGTEIYKLFVRPVVVAFFGEQTDGITDASLADILELYFGVNKREIFEAKVIKDFHIKALKWPNKEQMQPLDRTLQEKYIRRGAHVYIRIDLNDGARFCELETKDDIFVLTRKSFEDYKPYLEILRYQGKKEYEKPDLRLGSRDGL